MNRGLCLQPRPELSFLDIMERYHILTHWVMMGQHTTVQHLSKRDVPRGGDYAVLQPLLVPSEMHVVGYQEKSAAPPKC